MLGKKYYLLLIYGIFIVFLFLLPYLSHTGMVTFDIEKNVTGMGISITTGVINPFANYNTNISVVLHSKYAEQYECKYCIGDDCEPDITMDKINITYWTVNLSFQEGEYMYNISCKNESDSIASWNSFEIINMTKIELSQSFGLKHENISIDINFTWYNGSYADGECYLNGSLIENYATEMVFDEIGNFSLEINCSVEGAPNMSVVKDVVVSNTFALTHEFPGVSFSSLAWADLNNNGWWDLVYSGYNGNNNIIKIINNNENELIETNLNTIAISMGSLSLGDINNNGKLDLILSGITSFNSPNYLNFYKNINNNFELNTELNGISYSSTTLTDLNRNGKLKLISSGTITTGVLRNLMPFSSSKTSIHNYENNNFTFSKDLENLSYSSITPLKTTHGDYLIISGITTSENPKTLLLNSDLSIAQEIINLRQGSIAVADLNNSGKTDFIISGYDSNSNKVTAVYMNTGSGFENTRNLTASAQSSMAVGDYNNNGWMDLVIIDSDNAIFYRNEKGTLMQDGSYNIPVFDDGSIAFFDYNDNGALDLAISGGGMTKVYNNQYNEIRKNQAPSPPAENFTTYFEDGQLKIGWGYGSDALTPKKGLYYNIRVGTTPEGNDIISGKYGGSSNPTQGYLGNMMQLRNYSINVSTEKTFFWQVQTIDTGLKQSEWSEIQIHDPCPYTDGDWNIDAECMILNYDKDITGKTYIAKNAIFKNSIINSDVYVLNGTLQMINSTINGKLKIYENAGLNMNISSADNLEINSTNVIFKNNHILNNASIFSNNISIKDSSIPKIINHGINNSLVNVTFNSINVEEGYIDIAWRFGVKSFENTFIRIYNVSDNLISESYTDSEGFAFFEVAEYRAFSDKIKQFNNHTIIASKEHYIDKSLSINISGNMIVEITLDETRELHSEGFQGTDFSQYNVSDEIENAIIRIDEFGEIRFNENISFPGFNVNNYINISYNRIYVDGSHPGLNKSANITFYNLPNEKNPALLRNGEPYNADLISYSDGTAVFRVDGFSIYSTTNNSVMDVYVSNLKNDKIVPGENIYFIVNYSDIINNEAIQDADCIVQYKEENFGLNYINGTYINHTIFDEISGRNEFVDFNVSCVSAEHERAIHEGAIEVRKNATLFMMVEELEGMEEIPSMIIYNLNNNKKRILLQGYPSYKIIIYEHDINNFNEIDRIEGLVGSLSINDINKNNKYKIISHGNPKESISIFTYKIYQKKE